MAVSYRPNEYEVTATSSDCVVQAGEAATGITNTAAVTSGAVTRTADDCETFSAIVVEKEVVGTPVVDGDRMTVTYDLAVTNRGSRDGSYDLDDELRFGEGITPQAVGDGRRTAPRLPRTDPRLGRCRRHRDRRRPGARRRSHPHLPGAGRGVGGCRGVGRFRGLHPARESEVGTGLTNVGQVTVGGWTRMDDACAPVDLSATTTTTTTSTTSTTATTTTTSTGTLGTGAGASRSAPTASAGRGELVRTGSPALGPAVLGGVLLLAGYALVRAGRRAST